MNIENVTISVIIPVYNAATTLHHCLESLDRQTYRKLELLFIDDGSTDDSLKMLTCYAARNTDPVRVIRVLHHERNRGVAAARHMLQAIISIMSMRMIPSNSIHWRAW